MTLIVHELRDSLIEQEIVPHKNTLVEAIRPHVYRKNSPSGSITLTIEDSLGNVLGSDTVAIADIGNEAYFHGYVRFEIIAGLKKGQAYKIKISGADGYSFDESAFVGWCDGFDLGKYEPTGDFSTAPLDQEIWERKTK